MRSFLPLIFLFSSLMVLPVSAENDTFASFVSAGLSYKDGQYQQAVDIYEDILLTNVESGPIYFNLGNSYYKLGNYGKALLNYERALNLIPRDSDLKYNYRYVQNAAGLNDQAAKESFVVKLFRPHVSFYSLDEAILMTLIIFFIFAFGYLGVMWCNVPRRVAKYLSVGIIVFFCIYIVGIVIKVNDLKGASIVLKAAPSMFEPREDSTKHYSLKEGEKVRVVNQKKEWIKIKRNDGKLGWVKLDLVEGI